MAKQSGLGDALYIAGYNISDDVLSAQLNGGPVALDYTPISKSAYVRLGGLRTGAMGFVAALDDAAGQEHPALSTLPTADVQVMYFHGATVGNSAACSVAKQVNYDGTRPADGKLTFAVDAQSNGFGLEWGTMLTPGVKTDTTATNGASFDTGGSLSFGGQAYLQVFALTGTNAVIRVEDSADNVSFAAVTGLTFTSATGRTTERLAISNTSTIRRYVRAVTSSGTFTSVSYAVVLVKNEAAGVVF